MTAPRFRYRLGWRSLRRVAPGLSDARYRELAVAMAYAMVHYGITTRARATAFVAQTAHETAGFRTFEEFASGDAYEGRRDLGNTHRGDGRRFKGRGLIMVTGRANYEGLSKALGHDFIAHPEHLATARWASEASAEWWQRHGCNELADTGAFTALTRRINGGLNGLESRREYLRRARRVARYLVPKRRPPS